MKNKMEIRLAGSGGQGVILASVILAEAAVQDGKYAAQSQSYGPEARGGMCKAEVVISSEKIDFPKVQHMDVLLALTQTSLDKYIKEADENCMILADSSLSTNANRTVIYIPILYTATEQLKKPIVSNIVAVGVLNQLLDIANHDSLEKAVLMHVPKGTAELNRQALKAGEDIIRRASFKHIA